MDYFVDTQTAWQDTGPTNWRKKPRDANLAIIGLYVDTMRRNLHVDTERRHLIIDSQRRCLTPQ